MKLRTLITALLVTAASMGTALAEQRTVILTVENMTCATCPYIVKKALSNVPGVEKATVAYEEKTATVSFDDATAQVPDLIAATTNAGFPSRLASDKSGQNAR
mgnify:CR=1 FL=1